MNASVVMSPGRLKRPREKRLSGSRRIRFTFSRQVREQAKPSSRSMSAVPRPTAPKG
ncbi:MAG: hypothetical protein II959_04175 [Clostridia bacterium]|nr:hypothetical protein [Clostridia bacterium]